MKNYFNKKLVMTKEENANFKNYTKCWICDNDYIDNDIRVRIAGKLSLENIANIAALYIEIVISILN